MALEAFRENHAYQILHGLLYINLVQIYLL